MISASLALVGLLTGAPAERGVALGLFSEDPDFSYEHLLDEIAGVGATEVSVVVPWYQYDVRSTEIEPHPRFTPRESTVRRVIRQARARGLRVLLYPILRLEYAATPLEWRGTIEPSDRAAWWRSYGRFILAMARLGRDAHAAGLAVGSELGSMDTDRAQWAKLLGRVRSVFRGTLVYSTNWDRLEGALVWDLVDLVGLSAYFELANEPEPTMETLVSSWREIRKRITPRVEKIGKPLVLTEVGYHSQAGTAARPWDEDLHKAVSLEEQRRCYEAFMRAWDDADGLQGVYFWNWYGWGGPKSREYTPRGKPAAREICRWYGGKKCPTGWGTDWMESMRLESRF